MMNGLGTMQRYVLRIVEHAAAKDSAAQYVRAEDVAALEAKLAKQGQQVAALRAALDGLFDYFYHMGMQDHPWYCRAADALDDTEAAAQAHDAQVRAPLAQQIAALRDLLSRYSETEDAYQYELQEEVAAVLTDTQAAAKAHDERVFDKGRKAGVASEYKRVSRLLDRHLEWHHANADYAGQEEIVSLSASFHGVETEKVRAAVAKEEE